MFWEKLILRGKDAEFSCIITDRITRLKYKGGMDMQIQIIPSIIVVAYLVGMMLVGFIVGKL